MMSTKFEDFFAPSLLSLVTTLTQLITEPKIVVGSWLGKISSSSCLTVLSGSRVPEFCLKIFAYHLLDLYSHLLIGYIIRACPFAVAALYDFLLAAV